MRFEQLGIPSFGPFTDLVLEFPVDSTDFHLIYGRNEAGKSSLLRAIRDLLYGVHGQTADNFLHPYRNLRICGTISSERGQRLSFQRRKGNKNTLLDAVGHPLPDDTLASYLGVVDRHFFISVFGLGSEELRRGSEALLDGDGHLGQALFSASLAGTPIHRILGSLDAEARALFDGRARTHVTIRPAVSEFEEMLRRSKAAVVHAETWEATLSELAAAEERRERLGASLRECRTRRDWMQRCLDALPTLGQLDEQQERLAALPATPTLGPGFVDETHQSIAERDRARESLAELGRNIARLEARIAENRPDETLLTLATELETAHQSLGVYQELKTETETMKARLDRVERELGGGMREHALSGSIEELDRHRVPAPQANALREAGKRLEEARSSMQRAKEEADRLRQQQGRLSQQVSGLQTADVSKLRSALAQSSGAADAARTLAQKQAGCEAAFRSLEAQHGLLTGAPSDHRKTFDLVIPGVALIRRFEGERGRIDADRERTEDSISSADSNWKELTARLERLERGGTLPTIADLEDARQERDSLLEQVVKAWSEGRAGVELDGRLLTELYPASVARADEIADRLREEAASVSQAEEIRSRLAELEATRVEARAELERVTAALREWTTGWAAAWSPISMNPARPEEMLEWREQWVEYRTRFESWEEARRALASAQAEVETAVETLAPLLSDDHERSLPALREEAERRVREADETKGARAQLDVQLTELDATLKALLAGKPELESEAERARQSWSRRCVAIGLPADTSVESGVGLLEARAELVTLYDGWKDLTMAYRRKQESIEDYETRVRQLADRAELAPATVETQVATLWSALETAREKQTRRSQDQMDLENESERLPRLREDLDRAEASVAAATANAEASNESELQPILANLRRRHEIESEIASLRRALHASARGESLDTFLERVQGEARDSLSADCQELDQAISKLELERDETVQIVARAKREKERLENAGDAASQYLQSARNAAARISGDAARYLRLRLATRFLSQQIETFREKNQGPLLARAGELFREVTAGSFEELRASFDEADTPILVGIREGNEVSIQGMSDGTRDQLYLALRLAAIEQHQKHHEPMPIILDDLLATFDDRRSQALLPILRDLGRKTQLMLFTHHRHIVDLTRSTLPAGDFQLLEL